MSITVAIADDQAMVRAGFAALLDAQDGIRVVAQAADGDEAIAAVAREHPDVVLMDVRMPVRDGLDAARRILGAERADDRPAPRIIMLTTFDIDDYVFEALEAGASGFLLKDALPAELVQAVRVVAAGEALLAPSVTRRLIERFRGGAPAPRAGADPLAELTQREVDVLTCIGRGLSNGEIAGELVIAEQTVKSHVSRILMKLGARDRVQAVIRAYDAGLVSPGG
ncbi:response regulator [Microbacterium sp. gxy059]|uniref:response regulator n=1 Tax=Microbacterium sp. gxy059 TaxID=2957199 RepID=UPI003D983E91